MQTVLLYSVTSEGASVNPKELLRDTVAIVRRAEFTKERVEEWVQEDANLLRMYPVQGKHVVAVDIVFVEYNTERDFYHYVLVGKFARGADVRCNVFARFVNVL